MTLPTQLAAAACGVDIPQVGDASFSFAGGWGQSSISSGASPRGVACERLPQVEGVAGRCRGESLRRKTLREGAALEE